MFVNILQYFTHWYFHNIHCSILHYLQFSFKNYKLQDATKLFSTQSHLEYITNFDLENNLSEIICYESKEEQSNIFNWKIIR